MWIAHTMLYNTLLPPQEDWLRICDHFCRMKTVHSEGASILGVNPSTLPKQEGLACLHRICNKGNIRWLDIINIPFYFYYLSGKCCCRHNVCDREQLCIRKRSSYLKSHFQKGPGFHPSALPLGSEYRPQNVLKNGLVATASSSCLFYQYL